MHHNKKSPRKQLSFAFVLHCITYAIGSIFIARLQEKWYARLTIIMKLSGKTIPIIEDELHQLEVLRSTFTKEGHIVAIAPNGADGLGKCAK